ncbi:hypothetical protein [Campylobacter lanienae]|uniref:putative barnase/colicin E5 family endoribonuclease n=1 Tax=Campylobacter lanienae TaxID=75658 RepID=UPI000BB44B9F|nr:hypothetical protein [Campylobacter lanienae]
MPTPTRNLLNEFKEAVKEIEKQVVKADNQPNLANQANSGNIDSLTKQISYLQNAIKNSTKDAPTPSPIKQEVDSLSQATPNLAQNSIKGDGFVTYPNSARQETAINQNFNIQEWVKNMSGVISDEWRANLTKLAKKHPEMFRSEADVFRVIKEIKDNPTHFFKNYDDDISLIGKKLNNNKDGNIGIVKNSGEIIHANKNRSGDLDRLQRKQLKNYEKDGAIAGTPAPATTRPNNGVEGEIIKNRTNTKTIPNQSIKQAETTAKTAEPQTTKAKEPIATQTTKTKATTKAEPTQETFDILKIDKNISDEQVETLLKEIEDKNLKVNLPLRDEEPLGKAFQKDELGYNQKRLLNLALNEQFLKRHKGFIERAEKTQSKAEFQKFLKENKAEVVEYIKDMVTNTLRYIDSYGEGYHFTNKSSLRRANEMILNLQNGKNFYFYNHAPNKITNPAPKSDYADKLVDGNEAIQGTYKISDEIKQDLIKSLKEFVGSRQNLAENIANIQSRWWYKIKEQERLAPSILEGGKKANNGYDENLKKALEHEVYLFNQFERRIVKNPQKTSSDLELARNYYRFSKGDTYTKQALDEINQTRQILEQELNIQPIKEFGTNYAEFYHDGKGAIDKLLTEREGQVAGAFEREELGDIDLVWGEVTDPIKHKGYGLAHILDKRMAEFMEQGLSKEEAEAKAIELINKLPDIIKNGEIIKLGENRVKIETPKDRAIIVLNYKGENNKWVLTAYKKDEALSQADLHQTKRNDPASSFIAEPTSKPNSTTTANKSQENILKGVDGKEYPNTVAGRWEKRVDEAFDWAYKNIYAKGVKSGIKGAGVVGRVFGSQESGEKIQRGLEKAFALQDEIGALSRLKSAYHRNNQVARMEAMKVYESLVKLEIDERVALFRMLDGQEVEPNLAGKLRPTYQKLRDKIDERAEQLISLGMLKGENAKENYIKYSYSQYYGKKDGAVGGFGIGKLRGRDENLSYEDRVQLGLIEDAAIAVTQTLNSQNSQIQKAILFKNLANEYAVYQPKDGYVKVSDESVGGGVKKYGALAGKYVPSAVYDDLQNAGLVSSIFDVIRPYTNVIDHIKVNLTVKNPATHGYNVLSNSVLAFLHGDLGANLKLMKLLASDKNSFNELLAKAEAMGLDTASDDIEMRNLLMANDEVAKEALKSQNPLGYYIAASWQNIYLTKNSATGRVARKAYAWEDKWFKLARFKKNLDIGMSDEAAFSDANSAYVDYSSHFNPALKVLDKTGVLPFFHFAVKSSIVVTKAAIKNPAKFAMLQTALIGSGASSLPYWFDSDQKDADNSRLPDWASSNYLPNLFGVKNQVQIGESGLYFNAARAMAGFRLSSIDDITGGGGLIGGLLDILRGRDSWGNDMVGKHDPAIKQLTARLDAFSKQFLPSITLGRYGRQGLAIATGNNPKNAYDEPMGLGELAGRFMGLRMINEKKELRSAAINAKNRYKKAKEKGDDGAMVVALNDFMACKAAASDMGVSLEALMKMKKRDIK